MDGENPFKDNPFKEPVTTEPLVPHDATDPAAIAPSPPTPAIAMRTDFGAMEMSFQITLGVLGALAILSAIFIPLYKWVSSSGMVDYCYVEPNTYGVPDPDSGKYNCRHYVNGYELKGHVPWGVNRTMSSDIPNTDKVIQEAAKFHCEIR